MSLALAGVQERKKESVVRRKANRISATVASLLGLLATNGCDKPEEGTAKPVALEAATPVELDTAELAAMYAEGSTNTDLQRNAKQKELQGTVVEWKGLDVQEVEASGEDCFKIQTSPTDTHPGTIIEACKSVDPKVAELAVALETDDFIDVKGTIDGVSARTIELRPAIVSRSDVVDELTQVCRKMSELAQKEKDLPEEAKREMADLEKCKVEAKVEKDKHPEKFNAMAKCVLAADDMNGFMKCAMESESRSNAD